MANLCLKTEDCAENAEKRQVVTKYMLEFHEMLYHQYVVMQNFENMLESVADYCRASQEHYGDESLEYAKALYFKAKTQHFNALTRSLALETVKNSIDIWTQIPLNKGSQDLGHAQALLLKATILAQTEKYRWAVKVYRKAAIIISEIEDTRIDKDSFLDNVVQECQKVIQLA